jgi:predicted MFS family arabinose efflux permease
MGCGISSSICSPIEAEGSQPAQLTRVTQLLFAIAAGVSVANIYCAQPLLGALAQEFGFSKSSVGSVITVTQIGYALGLLFIVPLGDLLNRRRLVLSQLSLSAIALAVVSFAHAREMLLIGLFLVGLLAVVVQVLVAFAASLAPPEKRGSAVGAVTGGVVLGILLARVVAGAVSDFGGWRAVYLTSMLLTLLLTGALLGILQIRGLRCEARMRTFSAQLLRFTAQLPSCASVQRLLFWYSQHSAHCGRLWFSR